MVLEDSKGDFNQKYGNCIVRASYKGGDQKLYQIHEFESDNTDILSGHILNENGSWIPNARDIADLEFDFTIPRMGMINVDSNVMYVRRTTTKQYRQAFTFKNRVIIGSVIESDLSRIKGHSLHVESSNVIKAIFNPKYYSLEEALEKVYSGEAIACAISHRYYVAVSPYLPFVYLGFMGKVIGKIDRQTGGCFLYREARSLTEDIMQYMDIAGECNDIQSTS